MSAKPEKTSPLTSDHRTLLISQFGLVLECAKAADIDTDDESENAPETSEVLDEVVRWWHAQPAHERPERDDMVFALGIAMGDYVRHVLDVEWRAVHDEDGVEFALVNEKGDGQHIFWPVSSVAKRFDDSPDGFVCDFLDAMFSAEAVQPLLREEDNPPEPLLPEE